MWREAIYQITKILVKGKIYHQVEDFKSTKLPPSL